MKGGRTLFRIHSLLGLITGIILLIVSISGSLLVFQEEIDHFLNDDILTVPVKTQKVPLNTIYQTTLSRFPQAESVRFRRLPEQEGQAIEMNVEQDGKYILVYADPYTGQVLGQRVRFTFLMDWLLRFHYSLFIGKAGELMVALTGLGLLGLIFTGMLIYRKFILKVILFRVSVQWRNWRTASSGMHRIIGVWSLLFNFLIAVTGVYILYPSFTPSYYEPEAIQQRTTPFRLTLSVDKLIKKSKDALPGFIPKSISLPRKPGNPVMIYGALEGQPLLNPYGNYVSFDSDTGLVQEIYNLQKQSLWVKIDGAVIPLHFGMYGGWAVKIIYCFFGIMPGFLALTGGLLWWRRRHIPKRSNKVKTGILSKKEKPVHARL